MFLVDSVLVGFESVGFAEAGDDNAGLVGEGDLAGVDKSLVFVLAVEELLLFELLGGFSVGEQHDLIL
jgi:hypothetical protein